MTFFWKRNYPLTLYTAATATGTATTIFGTGAPSLTTSTDSTPIIHGLGFTIASGTDVIIARSVRLYFNAATNSAVDGTGYTAHLWRANSAGLPVEWVAAAVFGTVGRGSWQTADFYQPVVLPAGKYVLSVRFPRGRASYAASRFASTGQTSPTNANISAPPSGTSLQGLAITGVDQVELQWPPSTSTSSNWSGIDIGLETITSILQIAAKNLGTVTVYNATHVKKAGIKLPIVRGSVKIGGVLVPLVPPVIMPDMLAEWLFSEGSGSTSADTSGASNNLTATGNPWSASGKSGSGTLPTMSDYFATTSGLDVSTFAAWGITMWFRRTGTPAGSYGQFLYDGANFWMELNSASQWGFLGTYSSAALPLNEWHHLTWSLDAPTATINCYLDGVFSHAINLTGNDQRLLVGGNLFRIGAGPGGGDLNVPGIIDSIRIYKDTLTLAQIQADMNS